MWLQAAERSTRCVCGAMILLMAGSSLLSQDTSLAFRRAEHLRHGINLSHWYAQVFDPKGYTKEHFDTYDTAQDMALIKAMGFDHVRFTLNCEPMFHAARRTGFPLNTWPWWMGR